MTMDVGSPIPRVVLNISGNIFETLETTLNRFPATLLGDQERRLQHFCWRTNQYFFNRNRTAFEAILFFYQSGGRLTKPPDLNMDTFEEECAFFELPKDVINGMKCKEGFIVSEEKTYELGCLQKKLWDFVEHPESSLSAKMFGVFCFVMITFSVFFTCLETLPVFRSAKESKSISMWFVTELIFNTWFLFELLLRFAAVPEKWNFLKSPLSIVDILAVVPYFLIMPFQRDVASFSFLRILRFIRIIRLLRLGKYSRRIKLVGAILVSSLGDLKLLLLCLMLVVILGGSVLYFAEFDSEGSQFTSIPNSLWWGIQTVVVLGYGDIVPRTLIGKLLASVFMVFGALTISLPVLSVVTKFTSVYGRNMENLRE